MRAFQLTEAGRGELRQVPPPQAGPGEVLLDVAGAGVCHSDLHLLHAPMAVFPMPMTLGHEVAGVVAETGPGVVGWAPGTPALVYLCWGCGRCRACSVGAENYCEAYPRQTVPGPGLGRDGGMAEQVVVPARHLIPLGELDPISAAPLTDAALTPYHAIRESADCLLPGATAVVVGIGGLGHMAVQILEATTAARIVAVDTDESRLAQATELGAEEVLISGPQTASEILALTNGVGADVVFDVVGVTETLAMAAESVRSGGRIMMVGLGGGELALNALALPFPVPWGVSVQKPFAGTRSDLQEVVALAHAGHISVQTTSFRLDDAEAVLGRLEQGDLPGRAVLVP